MKPFYLVSGVVFLADRLTKYLVLSFAFERIEVLSFLHLVKYWNRGIVFGFFADFSLSNLIFSIFTAMILGVLFYLARKSSFRCKVAFGMIFGGGLGNLVDRVIYSAVLDFIDLHLGKYHWPAFNVADLAITFGVILVVLRYRKDDFKILTL